MLPVDTEDAAEVVSEVAGGGEAVSPNVAVMTVILISISSSHCRAQ